MELVRVEARLCVGCGECVRVCPFSILELDGGHRPRATRPDTLRDCMRCGQCVAVCPRGALSLAPRQATGRTPAPAAPPPAPPAAVSPALLPPAAAVEHHLAARRTVRLWKQGAAVADDVVVRILECARFAPTAHNSQSVCWIVIRERTKVVALEEAAIKWMRSEADSEFGKRTHYALNLWAHEHNDVKLSISRGAPHLLIAISPDGAHDPATSCTIALSYVDILAPTLGVGTCWSGKFKLAIQKSPEVSALAGIPPGYKCYGAMLFGVPDVKFSQIPERDPLQIKWL
eukprot:TRINITY_DN3984_c0_g1_i15.p1 TRINITY_DN3984_c0_g1~~TRINITY_DN3984_c0_g1_i15.p1  ORF type:complete len:288 (+),score=55.41 TRINITY_DN3984_c0_g1_i15:146-1009(+)